MIRSMTGFGRAEGVLGGGRLSVEIRSVNARHLDVRVRPPRELAGLEAKVRRQVSARVARGNVDLTLRLTQGRDTRVEIDVETARSYAEAARTLAAEHDLAAPTSAEALLGLPGVVRVREPDLDEELAAGVVSDMVERACDEMLEMRCREGEALAAELRSRSAALADALSEIEARAEEVREGLRARLDKRLAALAPELALEPGRLEQEVVFYADRMDVTEETVRFRSHLAQFHETLEREGSVGRRLEFILQELTRETNTIGSKAGDAPIAQRVVDLKTELEKLREQVLNVE